MEKMSFNYNVLIMFTVTVVSSLARSSCLVNCSTVQSEESPSRNPLLSLKPISDSIIPMDRNLSQNEGAKSYSSMQGQVRDASSEIEIPHSQSNTEGFESKPKPVGQNQILTALSNSQGVKSSLGVQGKIMLEKSTGPSTLRFSEHREDLQVQGQEVDQTEDDWYYNPKDKDEDHQEGMDKANKIEEEAQIDEEGQLQGSRWKNKNIDADDGEEEEEVEEDETYNTWSELDLDESDYEDVDKLDEEDNLLGVEDGMKETSVEEELIKKSRTPTAPSSMVVFYTWMIVALLVMVVGISTCQTGCKKGQFSVNRQPNWDERKRLVDHEYA